MVVGRFWLPTNFYCWWEALLLSADHKTDSNLIRSSVSGNICWSSVRIGVIFSQWKYVVSIFWNRPNGDTYRIFSSSNCREKLCWTENEGIILIEVISVGIVIEKRPLSRNNQTWLLNLLENCLGNKIIESFNLYE